MEEPKLTKSGGIAVDDRGSLRFVNDFDFAGVKRFYQVENHRQGFIRAWHGHLKEAKYVYVASGTALVGVTPLVQNDNMLEPGGYVPSQRDVKTFVLSAKAPQVLYIPAGYANGFKNLEDNTIIMFFSTTTLEESKGDDLRFSYTLVDIWKEVYR
jgi:dTDP-4-dehydrorhamnose 3,5-epimerase-like enzyme